MSHDTFKDIQMGHLMTIIIPTMGQLIELTTPVMAIPGDNKLVLLNPVLDGKWMDVKTGERYRLSYTHPDSGLIKFTGLVVKRALEEDQWVLHVLRISETKKIQRRQDYRLLLIEPVELKVAVGEREEVMIEKGQVFKEMVTDYATYKGYIKDISAGGVRVSTYDSLPLGQQILLIFSLGGKKFELEGSVLRNIRIDDVVDRYELGIRFINIDKIVQTRLVSEIFDKQRELLKKGMV